MKRFFILFLFAFSLHAKTIDVITHFMDDLFLDYKIIHKAGYQVRVGELEDYWQGRSPYSEDLQKILIFNPFKSFSDISYLPKEKLVLFVWEPVQVPAWYYNAFSRVYTWDDSLVDQVKFFKFYYPHMVPMRKDLPDFEEKKFCTMIASNFTFERRRMVEFFEDKPEEDFEFFGAAKGEMAKHARYRGPIPGKHSGPEKLEVLKDYKFCICFENCHHLQGYVTEKIFGCFAAGCIPIYWGAPNIDSYVPKDCYIDYRDFASKEHLYYYMKMMTEEVYEGYLNRIRAYLKTNKAALFSKEYFERIVCEAAAAK